MIVKLFMKSLILAMSVITVIFTFVPESIFEKYKLLSCVSDETNVILTRVFVFAAVLVLSIIINSLHLLLRKSIRIKGHNYCIHIKYGDLLKMRNCKKVINFDECFTTKVGWKPGDVKPTSLCGQYITKNEIQDMHMQTLIKEANLKQVKTMSKYQNKVRYESGKLVPNGEDLLLMAFSKLDEDGLARWTRDEFLDCLSTLWKEINKYYGQKDVCIPILGSGITRIEGASLTPQELLDIIIGSYKLSAHKIKLPSQLRIVYNKCSGISISKIGESI